MDELSLDSILADDTPSSVETVTEPVAVVPGQARDEAGRFATQQEQEAAAAVEQASQPDHEQHAPGTVPQGALHAERSKRQAAEAKLETFNREMQEMRQQIQRLSQPQTPQQEAAPVTIWDDPDAFLKNQLSPIQTALLTQKAEFSRMIAVKDHGAEVFDAAESALEQAAATPEGQALIQKLQASAHPAEDLIKWHKQQQSMTRVGNDPDAWFQAEYEKRLSDPAEQAKILERIRAGASPASRSNPITNLPPSLSRLPSSANQADDNDMSNDALFRHATR